jgi:CBS domain containing-hemolysin-like protein
MRAFYLATKPVVDLFNAMGNLLLKPFGIPPASEAGHSPHSEHELPALLRQSQHAGLIGRDDHELTESVFAFGDRRASEIMTLRSEIDFVTTSAKLGDVARFALTGGHTRLPVCKPGVGLDAPAGVIHGSDLLQAMLDQPEIAPVLLARPLARVAESTLLNELLRDLRHQRQHIALVADEHGTTTALVTLEDILEELVGEIEDEFDGNASQHSRRDGTDALIEDETPEPAAGTRVSQRDALTARRDDRHPVRILGRLPDV